jgi:hypothetical protein
MRKTYTYNLYGDGVVRHGDLVMLFTHQSIGNVIAIVNYSDYGLWVASNLRRAGWDCREIAWDPGLVGLDDSIMVYGKSRWSMLTSNGRQYWVSDVETGEYDGLPVLSAWDYYIANNKYPGRDSINHVALFAI